MKPQVVVDSWGGKHNIDLPQSAKRILSGNTYKDVSTVLMVPTRGVIPAKVVQCWMNLMPPMNQRFMRMFVIGMEVGAAYTQAIEVCLANPELSKFRYFVTLEEDNMPPPDGLIKLYEDMTQFDAVSGLYWTKGEGGQPMIYGDPHAFPKGFIPQIPKPETLQECNGLGMGFTMFKMDMFKKMPKPWFRTVQEYKPGPGGGARVYTQDLHFFEEAAKYGYRFAVDTRVKVGHYDIDRDIIW